MHPPNPRAELRQLFLDAFVAAVDVINTLDRGFALRDQAGGGAQIGGHHAPSSHGTPPAHFGSRKIDQAATGW